MIEIELIPKSVWGLSLKNLIRDSAWKRIRQESLKEYNNECFICSYKNRLQCDEVWSYNKSKKIVKLCYTRMICFYCHSAKHYFHTKSFKNIDIEKIDNHIMNLNNWDKNELDLHISKAYVKFIGLSEIKFKIDWGRYKEILENNLRHKYDKYS